MSEPLITTEQLAVRLGVSESLIYKLAQKEKIPCFRIGGNWRFDEAEVKGVLRKERQES